MLVTLHLLAGSAPRESGSRMIVTESGTTGSVGGGNLEFEATQRARALLADQAHGHQRTEMFGLGPELNQCCGGAVSLLFEVFDPSLPGWLEKLCLNDPVVLVSAVHSSFTEKYAIAADEPIPDGLPGEVAAAVEETRSLDVHGGIVTVEDAGGVWWVEKVGTYLQPLYLFGAGHVGQAVARILAPLPFRVTWYDGRPGVFPDDPGTNVRTVSADDPRAVVSAADAGGIFVVMTHSHQLDEDICFDVLQRGDFAWLGLIGSETKRRRFVHRLARRGVPEAGLQRLVCPIGLAGIKGKQPATIALSLAAQLMTTDEEGRCPWMPESN